MPLDDTDFNGGGGGGNDRAFLWCVYDVTKIGEPEATMFVIMGARYIARPYTVDSVAMDVVIPACCLRHIRERLQGLGFTQCTPRDPTDNPAIIESWL